MKENKEETLFLDAILAQRSTIATPDYRFQIKDLGKKERAEENYKKATVLDTNRQFPQERLIEIEKL